MRRNPSSERWQLPLAALAGVLTLFSFAPFGWWPLQILTLAGMFWLSCHACLRPAAAFRLGWAYGVGWSTAGIYWLYISMHDYGGLPGWMAALAVLLLGTVLGSFPAAAFGAAAWLRQRRPGMPLPVFCLLLLPALWTLSEWLRGWVLTGFPWVVSGYAHTASPLAGYAPLIGVYGIGWIAAVIAACLALLPRYRLPVIGAALLLGIGTGLHTLEWTQAHGEPMTVRLLQGNVPQDLKFAPEAVAHTLDLYREMVTARPADLIVTPETALPLLAHQLPSDYLAQLQAFLTSSNSHLALGLPISDGPGQYANSVIGLSPQQADAGGFITSYRYDKHHLVPFGEFIPPGARWFVEMMNIPLGDFARGNPIQPSFQVGQQQVLPNICYEDLFGGEISAQISAELRQHPNKAATVLLNMSNIAWFGDSLALPQHLQISQMRALETGRPMLRATNTGMTAVIDAKGRVLQQLPPLTRASLQATVQGHSGITPYIFLGNRAVVGVALLMLLLACFWPRRQRAT